ncbi:MAG: DNA alkylation repair protein [Anaerolineales bacterium]
MPAVELSRLARQTEGLAALLDDPVEFRRACLSLLEGYADRTRRTVWRPDEDGPWVLGVSRTVLRAVARSLSMEVQGRPDAARTSADSLWQSGIREGQALAAALVQTIEGAGAGKWAEAKVLRARDGSAVGLLAGPALSGWRRVDPSAFLEFLARVLERAVPRWREFGFRGLESALEDPGFPPVPRVFQILGATPREAGAEPRRAQTAAWRAAIHRSPAEAAQTLLEDLPHAREDARDLILTHLTDFPERQRARLQRALSDREAEGIIGASE